jgi:hypothetical protein
MQQRKIKIVDASQARSINKYLQHQTQIIELQRQHIVACCLKAGISEAEQTSISSQRFCNKHIRGNE